MPTRKQARRVKPVELNRWPEGYGDCISAGGPGEGICDHRPGGRVSEAGVDTRAVGATRPSGGTRKTCGGHRPPSLRAQRGVGAMDRRTAEGGLMRCPARGPGVRPARRRPCRQTGHRVRSTPVNRCIRAATDSGARGSDGGSGGTRIAPPAASTGRSTTRRNSPARDRSPSPSLHSPRTCLTDER